MRRRVYLSWHGGVACGLPRSWCRGTRVTAVFDYNTAFQRTLKWVTAIKRERIRNSAVAIAGLGIGGAHLLSRAPGGPADTASRGDRP